MHLIDGHLSSVALDKLNETTALSWGNLDIGDFSEALEERAKFILGDVTGESADEDGGVVRVGELIHRLGSTVVAHWGRCAHGVHAHGTATASLLHLHATLRRRTTASTLVFGGRSGNSHGTVSAVNALHFIQRTLLVAFLRKADKSITTGHAANGVGHDFGRFARGEAALKKGNQYVFVNLRTEIANEDGVLGTALILAAIRSDRPA